MTLISFSLDIGLAKKSSIPALKQLTRSAGIALAERAMIGTCFPVKDSNYLIFFVASKPSITGMIESMMIKSKFSVLNRLIASWPFSAKVAL